MVMVGTAGAEKARRTAKGSRGTSRIEPAGRDKVARKDAAAGHSTERTAERAPGRRLDTFPDRIDLRDWTYQPTLAALPDEIVNCAQVPEILDQGQEGACTGFALAAVINFLLHRRGAG